MFEANGASLVKKDIVGIKETAGKVAATVGIATSVYGAGVPSTTTKSVDNYGKLAQEQTIKEGYEKAEKSSKSESQQKTSQNR